MVCQVYFIRTFDILRFEMGEREELKHVLFNQWGELGITQKPGGPEAYKRLLDLCDIQEGQRVLDIGCGTGYTACFLAKEYQANVVAADINPKILNWAKRRIRKAGLEDRVEVIVADAEKLPFEGNNFDVAIAESVLILCDQQKVASEAYRVLRSKGIFGASEITIQKPPSVYLRDLLSKSHLSFLGLFNTQDDWEAIFTQAGFETMSSKFYQINMLEQFVSMFKTHGILRTLSAFGKLIVNPQLRSVPGVSFKDGLKILSEFRSIWGYGQYLARKP